MNSVCPYFCFVFRMSHAARIREFVPHIAHVAKTPVPELAQEQGFLLFLCVTYKVVSINSCYFYSIIKIKLLLIQCLLDNLLHYYITCLVGVDGVLLILLLHG